MPIMTVGYVKGQGKSTTTALGLTAAAPAQARALMVECDPSGGDLAARHGLTFSPGLVELATATRSAAYPPDVLTRCAQTVSLHRQALEVVVAPAGAVQTRAALQVLVEAGRAALSPPDRWVVADCGRLDFTSPVWPLLAVSDVVLVLVSGSLGELAHLRECADELLRVAGDRLTVALGPDGGPYGRDDVTELFAAAGADRFRPAGQVPRDRRAAELLDGRRAAGRGWRRLPLLQALGRFWTDMPTRDEASRSGRNDVRAEVR